MTAQTAAGAAGATAPADRAEPEAEEMPTAAPAPTEPTAAPAGAEATAPPAEPPVPADEAAMFVSRIATRPAATELAPPGR
jgi:hypothetical protein